MVAVCGVPVGSDAETVIVWLAVPSDRPAKLKAETVVPPVESMVVLRDWGTVKADVNAAPLVPKPMSAVSMLVPGLMRK